MNNERDSLNSRCNITLDRLIYRWNESINWTESLFLKFSDLIHLVYTIGDTFLPAINSSQHAALTKILTSGGDHFFNGVISVSFSSKYCLRSPSFTGPICEDELVKALLVLRVESYIEPDIIHKLILLTPFLVPVNIQHVNINGCVFFFVGRGLYKRIYWHTPLVLNNPKGLICHKAPTYLIELENVYLWVMLIC